MQCSRGKHASKQSSDFGALIYDIRFGTGGRNVDIMHAALVSIIFLYKPPHGQYAYSEHVIELLVAKFGIVTSASLMD